MENLKLEINYQCTQLEELQPAEQELINVALDATNNSYAKYSHFYVGAALRLADGRIVVGANQENAAFPSGLCAERSAIFAAQSQCPDQAIVEIAIAARKDRKSTRLNFSHANIS